MILWLEGASAVVGIINGVDAMTSGGGSSSSPNAANSASGSPDAGIIASNAAAIQEIGIDPSAAHSFASAGYTRADVEAMQGQGVSNNDINSIGANLSGIAAGQDPSTISGLGDSARSFLSGPTGQALISAAFTTAGTQYLTNATREASGIVASGAQQAANINSTAALSSARIQAGAATETGDILSTGALKASGQVVAGQEAAIGTAKDTLAKQTENQTPYMTAGTDALATLSAGLAPGGQFNKPFTMADAQNMPAYNFALEQGKQAIGNAAAAGGTELSSNNIQNLGKFAEGTAAQYEQQAFNQWLAQNNLSLGALQNMVATGQISTAQLQTAMQAAGVSIETAQKAIGTAQGAGTLGSAEALGTARTNAALATATGVTGAATAQSLGVQGISAAQAAGITSAANINAAGVRSVGNQAGTLIPAAVGSTLTSLSNLGNTVSNMGGTPTGNDTAPSSTSTPQQFMSTATGNNQVNLGDTTPVAAPASDPYGMAASGQTVNLGNSAGIAVDPAVQPGAPSTYSYQ
jgi:hypothetical protein